MPGRLLPVCTCAPCSILQSVSQQGSLWGKSQHAGALVCCKKPFTNSRAEQKCHEEPAGVKIFCIIHLTACLNVSLLLCAMVWDVRGVKMKRMHRLASLPPRSAAVQAVKLHRAHSMILGLHTVMSYESNIANTSSSIFMSYLHFSEVWAGHARSC